MKTEPTEALKYADKELSDIKIVYSGATKDSKMFKHKDLVCAFEQGQSSPKIKPLNWEFHGIYYSAQTAFGAYILEENEENENMCDLYFGSLLLRKNIPVNEAKCIAQQNLETKIKKCLM